MSKNKNLTSLDPFQMAQRVFDNEQDAQRVILVGTELDLPNIQNKESLKNQIEPIYIEKTITIPEIKVVEVEKVIEKIVPQVIYVDKIIEKPEIKIIEIEKIVEKHITLQQNDKNNENKLLKILLSASFIIIIGLVIALINK